MNNGAKSESKRGPIGFIPMVNALTPQRDA